MYKKNNSLIIYVIRSFYLLMFLFLINISHEWSVYNNRSKIKIVEISNTKILKNDAYEPLIDGIINNNIFDLNITNLNNTFESHPYVKAARISNHYPNKVKIEIIEREPIAILKINPNIMIDKDCTILPDLNNFKDLDLPILTNFNFETDSNFIGEKTNSLKIQECIQWLSDIQKNYTYLYDNLSELKITSSNEIELILLDYPTKVFLGQSKIKDRILILKEFEKNLHPKKISDYTYLDMRYKNQIVVKERRS